MARSTKHPGKSPEQQIEIARLVEEALQLRAEGLTYSQIGQRQGCGKRTAQRRVLRAIERMHQEPAEAVCKLELERCDRMFAGLAKAGAFAGDPRAVMAAVKVLERRARYLGIDSPEKHEHTGKDGAPIAVSLADVEEALRAAASNVDDPSKSSGGEGNSGGVPGLP